MIGKISRFALAFAPVGAAFFSQQALAGSSTGVIIYAPGSVPVPVLGGAGLIALSVLLTLVAFRFMKARKQGGGMFLVLAVLTGALASGGSGIKLISDAYAVVADIQMTSASGGQVSIPSPGYHRVINNTGGTQRITAINMANGCYIQPVITNGGGPASVCSTSTTLQDQAFCEIDVCCPGPNGGGCLTLE